MDAEAIRSIEQKGKLEQPIKSRNFVIFFILIIICLFGLFLRSGYLQIVKGDYYQDLSQGNRLRIYPITAPRGIIYDQTGQPLVYNTPSFDLVVNLNDFFDNSKEKQEEILGKISVILADSAKDPAVILNVSEESKRKDSSASPQNDKETSQNNKEIKESLNQDIEEARGKVSQMVLLKGIERSAALILETTIDDWPGFRLEKNAQRQYAAGSYLAHIIGYTGQVTPLDLEDNPDYWLNDQIGKSGLECFYEELLRGEPGQEQIEVDSLGKTQRLLAVKLAKPGQGLVLHLDKNLQIKLQDSLDRMLKKLGYPRKRKAAAIAINPQNGSVLALVSLPSFDSNLFVRGISQEDLIDLENDSSQPFLNRALAGQYPPGSTIKPLIGAAALQEKAIGSRQSIDCHGAIAIANKYNPEIIYNFPDWKNHGPIGIIEAIAQSCNVFFYTAGGGYGRIEGLGLERIKKYLEYFGLGRNTGIDLPHEEIGLIPDQEWKEAAKSGEEWYLGDTYHLSIGQGDILVTPLQMTMSLAAIANGGILYQPQIVDKIIDTEGNLVEDISVQKMADGFIDSENIKIVQEGMRQAVLAGSARALADLPVKAAGKTGTAQFGNQGETHAWFIGYAPYDNPEIVIAVLVEAGGQGHEAAAPVAKEVLQWYFSQ